MRSTFKKTVIIFITLVLSICSAFATYIISDYKFNITGKTRENALRAMLKGPTVFQNEAGLKIFLEEKKQEMINTRLFKFVKLTYKEVIERVSENEVVYVMIICDVTDASSLLIMPYPKYDSNTGFEIGIKIKENNLFGNFAHFDGSVEMKFSSISLKNADYSFVLPVTDYPIGIGDAVSSFSISGEFTSEKNIKNLGYKFILEKLKLLNADFVFNSEGNFSLNQKNKSDVFAEAIMENLSITEKVAINASFFIKLKLFDIGIEKIKSSFNMGSNEYGIDASIEVIPSEKSVWGEKSFLKLKGFIDKDFNLGKGSNIRTDVNFALQSSDSGEILRTLKPAELQLDVVFSSDNNLEVRTRHYFDFDRKRYNTKSSLGFIAFDYFQPRGIIKTYSADNYKGLTRLDLDFDLTASFNLLSDSLMIYPEITIYDVLNYPADEKNNSNTYIEFMALTTYSGGEINYYSSESSSWTFRDNFRTGIEYGIENAFRYIIGKEFQFFFRGYAKGFFKVGNYFNPSFRLYASASNTPEFWFDKGENNVYRLYSESDSDYYYEFNAYNFSSFTFIPKTLNEFIRGVRLSNPFISTGGPKAKAVLTGNVNLIYGLINFEDFAHLYIYPFYDFALFFDPYIYIHSAGLEMVTIMDSHPSYPIRVSVGFNMDSVIEKIKGGSNPLEYEVFVGLGWLF